jgi:hypothetical protein
MKRLLGLVPVLALALAACNTPPATPPPPFDQANAQAMLLRTLNAEIRGDLEGTKQDLFPRNNNTLAACAKARLGNARPATLGDDPGSAPAEITSVTLKNVHQQEGAWIADYDVTGNSNFSGSSEMFVYANGRWWIKCGI